MGKIDNYIDFSKGASSTITSLKNKAVVVPSWKRLRLAYDASQHEVLTDTQNLRDKMRPDNTIEKSTRLSLGMEKLLVSRMSQFMFTIPPKRIYKNTEGNETRQQIAKAIEAIYKHARITAHNLKRAEQYFACCEIFTLWYVTKDPNTIYGFDCDYKLKCKTFSPKDGTALYPLFDEHDDMIAMSIEYSRTVETETVNYFETWTEDRHYKWKNGLGVGGWELAEPPTEIKIMKIPGIYLSREEAIYEDVAEIRKEIEYTLSRNGNILSYNAAPILKVIGELVDDSERKGEDQRVWRLEKGGEIGYVEWNQSNAAMSYQISQLVDLFWTLSQMPDISFANMQKLGNIGYDARETLLTDAHLKVGDEAGDWLEAFDRETNVIKAFLKEMHTEWRDEIDNVEVEHAITPFIQKNEKEEISKRMTANGGKPIESQRESIVRYGMSLDPNKTMEEIRKEEEESASVAIPDIFGSGQ